MATEPGTFPWLQQLKQHAFLIAFPDKDTVPPADKISLTVNYNEGWGQPNDGTDTFDPEYLDVAVSAPGVCRSYAHAELSAFLIELFT